MTTSWLRTSTMTTGICFDTNLDTNNEGHEAWDAFVDWITSTDLSEVAQYEQAVQQLDIENFTSFIILELWAGDTDWGFGNW